MSTTSGQAQMVGLVGSLFTFGAPSISSKIRGLPLPSATATPPLSLLPLVAACCHNPRWSGHHHVQPATCESEERARSDADVRSGRRDRKQRRRSGDDVVTVAVHQRTP